MNSNDQNTRELLNSFQANRLRITCQYVDKLLGDIKAILHAATSQAAFSRYSNDVIPARRRTMEDYIARVRAQLARVLDGQGISPENPSIPASRAIHVILGAIDIAAEELKPNYMTGYGAVPESVATELHGIAGELASLIHRFDSVLLEGAGEDLQSRLQRLEQSGNDLNLLARLEQIVRDRGLVEFRAPIAAILDRAEDRSFEIAVFGRVSSGKSSLLNAILGTDVLPVGVTPVTAVPTRIIHAEKPSLTVWFSDAPTKNLEISQLQEFATEQLNPGNKKHVTRLVVALPSSRLQGGVAFMDTPGLGSLATSGAIETLAYLPKCDLGVVLIDAGSTLTAEDVQTITALQQAAIPVNVLLSKADLLTPEDRALIVRYVKDHLASECRLNLPVHPVSVLPAAREMLEAWFANQIVPLYSRSQELRAASLRRKIGALRQSVASALAARLNRGAQSSPAAKDRARAAEALLRRTTGRIAETRALCASLIQEIAASVPEAVADASKRLLHSWSTSNNGVVVPGQVVRDCLTQFFQLQVRKLQGEITNLADQLSDDLQRCAADLRVPDAPAPGEFQAVIRGTPVLESLPISIAARRPTLAGRLGRRAAEHQLARQISRQLGDAFWGALEAYGSLVQVWADSVISQLQQKFENYAEGYRAQAEQALASRTPANGDRDGLAAALAQLQSPENSESETGAHASAPEAAAAPETSHTM